MQKATRVQLICLEGAGGRAGHLPPVQLGLRHSALANCVECKVKALILVQMNGYLDPSGRGGRSGQN